FTVFEELGIRYGAAGENIAAGQRSASEVMESWMNSSGHRQNILSSNFRKIGIGLYKSPDGYGYYWVQIFSD
ncbi:MAG: CAP domain-containing protein, partial [Ruminiclostridium sp.]